MNTHRRCVAALAAALLTGCGGGTEAAVERLPFAPDAPRQRTSAPRAIDAASAPDAEPAPSGAGGDVAPMTSVTFALAAPSGGPSSGTPPSGGDSPSTDVVGAVSASWEGVPYLERPDAASAATGVTMSAAQLAAVVAYEGAVKVIRTAQSHPVSPEDGAVAAALTTSFAEAIRYVVLEVQLGDGVAVRWPAGADARARYWQVDLVGNEAHLAGCQRYAAVTYSVASGEVVSDVDVIEHFGARLEQSADGARWLLAGYQSHDADGWRSC